MVKGIIFDMDGVLLDSMPVWQNAGSSFLKQMNRTPFENLDEELRTMSLMESVGYLIQTYDLNMNTNQVLTALNDSMDDAYRNIIPLKEGVEEFLLWMKSQGIPAVIATSSIKVLAQAALKRLGIAEYFLDIITDADAGLGKQFPDIFLMAADRLGTKPSETWVFEDSLHAMETAKKAGFLVAAVEEDTAKEYLPAIQKLSDRYLRKLTDFILYQ